MKTARILILSLALVAMLVTIFAVVTPTYAQGGCYFSGYCDLDSKCSRCQTTKLQTKVCDLGSETTCCGSDGCIVMSCSCITGWYSVGSCGQCMR
jgi:hypothetical protein